MLRMIILKQINKDQLCLKLSTNNDQHLIHFSQQLSLKLVQQAKVRVVFWTQEGNELLLKQIYEFQIQSLLLNIINTLHVFLWKLIFNFPYLSKVLNQQTVLHYFLLIWNHPLQNHLSSHSWLPLISKNHQYP